VVAVVAVGTLCLGAVVEVEEWREVVINSPLAVLEEDAGIVMMILMKPIIVGHLHLIVEAGGGGALAGVGEMEGGGVVT